RGQIAVIHPTESGTMNTDNSPSSSIWVLTIHDRTSQGYLSFDIKDILVCLGWNLLDHAWVIAELNCTGLAAQSRHDAIDNHAEPELVLFSTEELLAVCQKFGQTIDAALLGVPHKRYDRQALRVMAHLELFPETPADLIIR